MKVLLGVSITAALVFAGALAWQAYHPAEATVYLENQSLGTSTFYVNGSQVCSVASGTLCTIRLSTGKEHTLSAITWYLGDQHTTPVQVLKVERGAEYRYISCGMTGTPQVNCGLFRKYATPPVY